MSNRKTLRHLITAVVLVTAPAAAVSQSPAAAEAELLGALNAVRAQPRSCDDRDMPAAPALQWQPAIARAAEQVPSQGRPALQREGYAPGRIELLIITGARTVGQVLESVQQQHCATLMNAELRDLGVARSGNRWTLVFTQPGLDPALGDWRQAGRRVLALVNDARRSARLCGKDRYEPAAPLAWNDALAAAAHAHATDMARTQQFEHRGSDGSAVGQRVSRQNYAWQAVGENIAAGAGSAQQVVAGWLKSPGHCANLMSADYTQMGAAYVLAPDAPLNIYWAQVFGTPRAPVPPAQKRRAP